MIITVNQLREILDNVPPNKHNKYALFREVKIPINLNYNVPEETLTFKRNAETDVWEIELFQHEV